MNNNNNNKNIYYINKNKIKTLSILMPINYILFIKKKKKLGFKCLN